MKKNISKVAYGATSILEAVIALAKSNSAPDFMYYICRVFGVAMPLPVAVAVRILLLTTSGYALLDGLKKLCTALYKKVAASVQSKATKVRLVRVPMYYHGHSCF